MAKDIYDIKTRNKIYKKALAYINKRKKNSDFIYVCYCLDDAINEMGLEWKWRSYELPEIKLFNKNQKSDYIEFNISDPTGRFHYEFRKTVLLLCIEMTK